MFEKDLIEAVLSLSHYLHPPVFIDFTLGFVRDRRDLADGVTAKEISRKGSHTARTPLSAT
jgi:hypothetical protein